MHLLEVLRIRRQVRQSVRRSVDSEQGFTLVELLVSLIIFSILMATAGYSLSMIATLLPKLEARFAPEVRSLSELRDSIAGCYFFVGRRSSFPPGNIDHYYFFYGNARELQYVSSRPVSGQGLALTRLRYENKSLLLEEIPLYSDTVNYQQPEFPAEGFTSHVIMNNIEHFKIDYFFKGRRLTQVRESLPDSLKLTYRKQDMAASRELFISLKSDFWIRKGLVENQSLFDMDM